MKRILVLSLLVGSLRTFGGTNDLPVDPAATFARAEEAYKAGHFDEAIAAYDHWIAADRVSASLFFNRGNANFKKGDLGAAILDYRRAGMLDPRDGDIQANLRFALERAGVVAPDTSPLTAIITRLTAGEWLRLTLAAYWLAALLFAHFLWWGHRWARKAALAALVAGAFVLAGWLERRHLDATPEFVVLNRVHALFAPFDKATPHFELPAGSVVREIGRANDWIEVRLADKTGWIPARAGASVLAWHTGPAP